MGIKSKRTIFRSTSVLGRHVRITCFQKLLVAAAETRPVSVERVKYWNIFALTVPSSYTRRSKWYVTKNVRCFAKYIPPDLIFLPTTMRETNHSECAKKKLK